MRDLIELVDAGDLGATRLVNDAGRAIGRVLADLCNALNPEAIIVGGELSEAATPLLERDPRVGRPLRAAGAAQGVAVLRGELGDRAEVLGALALVIANTEGLSSRTIPAIAGPRARRAGEGGACRVDIGFRHVRRSPSSTQNRRRAT